MPHLSNSLFYKHPIIIFLKSHLKNFYNSYDSNTMIHTYMKFWAKFACFQQHCCSGFFSDNINVWLLERTFKHTIFITFHLHISKCNLISNHVSYRHLIFTYVLILPQQIRITLLLIFYISCNHPEFYNYIYIILLKLGSMSTKKTYLKLIER